MTYISVLLRDRKKMYRHFLKRFLWVIQKRNENFKNVFCLKNLHFFLNNLKTNDFSDNLLTFLKCTYKYLLKVSTHTFSIS